MHGNKLINYGTPKKLQKSKDDTRWHNKNNQCRIYKGKHQFTELEIEYLFQRPWVKQWRCKCGKKGPHEYIDKPSWLN